MINKPYILQTKEKGYSGCYVISLLNARIYYNNPYLITLYDKRWEVMVDKYLCRYGSAINRKEALFDLSLVSTIIDRDEIPDNIPTMITSFTKVGFHCSLVINTNGKDWTIVNYDGFKGNLITTINKDDIDFVPRGNINDKHYFLNMI